MLREWLNLEVSHIQEMIREVGLAPTKAKNISKLAKILVESYEGEIPDTFEGLESLPGVGHKTAGVVMAQAFGVPAFPIDTHIHRLAARWGLSNGTNVVKTEKDLKAIFPKESWNASLADYLLRKRILPCKKSRLDNMSNLLVDCN